MVYVPSLSTTEVVIMYKPFGPSTVPVKLASEPFIMTPFIKIWCPAVSVSTLASPLTFNVSSKGLKFASVPISPVTSPSTGPIAKFPPPDIV